MTMQTVALAGAAVLALLLLLVSRRRRAATGPPAPVARTGSTVERSAPLPPVALAAAESAERMAHMGPPSPEPMDWPPFTPDEPGEERALGGPHPADPDATHAPPEVEPSHGDVAVAYASDAPAAAEVAEPVVTAASYASAYPEGTVVTEPGWPMPGELDMGDWQPAAPSALGASVAAAGVSVEAAPTPEPRPADELGGDAIGSFEPASDAIGGFDPAAGWSEDADQATMEIGVAEPGAGSPGADDPSWESPADTWEPADSWEETPASWEPTAAQPGAGAVTEAEPEPQAEPEAMTAPGVEETRWPDLGGDDVEIQVVPTIDDEAEPDATPQAFMWEEPEVVLGSYDDDDEIDAPAFEHFVPMDGPLGQAPEDPPPPIRTGVGDAPPPESITGRFALGGFAVAPGQEALANVPFREALPAAPEPSDIELIADGALNCRPDDVVVLIDPGVAPTREGFTVRVASLAPGPFAASGTFRVV